MNKKILTAASQVYEESLICLIASLNINWPNHPEIEIYDIGMSNEALDFFYKNKLNVIHVPEFCEHWRKHFTWKIWCWNNNTSDQFVWLDAGIVILEPLDSLFDFLDKNSYFVIPTYHSLDKCASHNCVTACGLSDEHIRNKMTFAGGIIGFKKNPKNIGLLSEALIIAMDEKNIKAYEPYHRHDQAIISALMYKYYIDPVILDGIVYGGWESPRQTINQKIWVHRRNLDKIDIKLLKENFNGRDERFVPILPLKKRVTIRTIFHNIKNLRNKRKSNIIYNGVRDSWRK